MKKVKIGAYLLLIVLVFMVATGVYYSHYENTVGIINSEYGAKIELI